MIEESEHLSGVSKKKFSLYTKLVLECIRLIIQNSMESSDLLSKVYWL